jgi:iron complex transport system ATP-binding protein
VRLVTHHIHEVHPEVNRVVLLRDGGIHDDGPNFEMLNGHSLSALFSEPVERLEQQAGFQVVPAKTA